ncbi:hypothetical protein, partial [Marinobacterium sp. MBR-109]|uniref:hypothetical protein n=1 Tax=Marinobacterium sp. MBR-109 TaxID=3156462 RepID=UPI003397E550
LTNRTVELLGATCCLKRGAYSTAARFSVNRFFRFLFQREALKQRYGNHSRSTMMNQKTTQFNSLLLAHRGCSEPFPVERLKRGGEFYRHH